MKRTKRSKRKRTKATVRVSRPRGSPIRSARREDPAFDRVCSWLQRYWGGWAVLGFFFLGAAVGTFPLVLRMRSALYGIYRGIYSDIFAAVSTLWWYKYALWDLHMWPTHNVLLSGPYETVWGFSGLNLLMFPVTLAFGAVFSCNTLLLMSFVLSGVGAYYLTIYLTGSRYAGIAAGVIYAFCPYHFGRPEHLDLVQVQWIPLFLLYLFKIVEERSRRHFGLLCLFGLLMVFGISNYHTIFMPGAVVLFGLVALTNCYVYSFEGMAWVRWRDLDRRMVQYFKVGALIAAGLLLIGGMGYFRYLMPSMRALERPVVWLERLRLTPTNLLLPSVDHPFFGAAVKGIVPILRNKVESAAYIGWVPLLLALYGGYRARRNWRAVFFVALGILSFWITLGPYWSVGGLKVPMPALLLHKLAPPMRAINRYAIFGQLGIAVLAGMGLRSALNKVSSKGGRLKVAAGVLALVALEFMPPLSRSTQVASSIAEAPPVYRWLVGQGLGDLKTGKRGNGKTGEREGQDNPQSATPNPQSEMVLEFPATNVFGLPHVDYIYYQRFHHRTLFNRHSDRTTIPAAYLPFWKDMDYPAALCDGNNLAMLAYFGVRYVLSHDRTEAARARLEAPSLPSPDLGKLSLPPGRSPSEPEGGLELAADFGDTRAYRVIAEPATVMLRWNQRELYNYLELQRDQEDRPFYPPQILSDGEGWRIMINDGEVDLVNLLDRENQVDLAFTAKSASGARTLEVLDDGTQIATFKLMGEPQRCILKDIQLGPGGEKRLRFYSPEGAVNIPSGSGGRIEASVAFSNFVVRSR